MILFGGGAYGINKLTKSEAAVKKITVAVTGVNPPKIRNGALVFSVNIALDNPSRQVLNLKKPYVTIYTNGKEIANSIPSEERVQIKANDITKITGLNIQIPFTKLGVYAVNLLQGKIPKMQIEVEVKTEADGIIYTDRKQFDI